VGFVETEDGNQNAAGTLKKETKFFNSNFLIWFEVHLVASDLSGCMCVHKALLMLWHIHGKLKG
jgi:hypothetical protein